MKKVLSIVLVVMLAMTMVVPAYAAGTEKLKAGAERLAKSPMQIYDNIKGEYDSTGLNPIGLFGGVLKGLFYTAKDAVHGAIDIVTFPVDIQGR